MAAKRIELSEAVQQLRGELEKAIEAGSDEALRFEVLELELEMQVAVTKEASAEAGGTMDGIPPTGQRCSIRVQFRAHGK